MANRVCSVAKYSVKDKDKFFFDANIWIGIIYEPTSSNFKSYDNLLKQITSKDAHIYINELVMSEVVNRIIGKQYSRYLRKNNLDEKTFSKKIDFRSTESYKKIMKSIHANLYQLKENLRCNSEVVYLEEILEYFEEEGKAATCMDFNDFIYAQFSKKNDFMLVSEDADMMFANNEITILTNNKKYI